MSLEEETVANQASPDESDQPSANTQPWTSALPFMVKLPYSPLVSRCDDILAFTLPMWKGQKIYLPYPLNSDGSFSLELKRDLDKAAIEAGTPIISNGRGGNRKNKPEKNFRCRYLRPHKSKLEPAAEDEPHESNGPLKKKRKQRALKYPPLSGKHTCKMSFTIRWDEGGYYLVGGLGSREHTNHARDVTTPDGHHLNAHSAPMFSGMAGICSNTSIPADVTSSTIVEQSTSVSVSVYDDKKEDQDGGGNIKDDTGDSTTHPEVVSGGNDVTNASTDNSGDAAIQSKASASGNRALIPAVAAINSTISPFTMLNPVFKELCDLYEINVTTDELRHVHGVLSDLVAKKREEIASKASS